MTSEQRADLPENEEETAADRLIVDPPTPTQASSSCVRSRRSLA